VIKSGTLFLSCYNYDQSNVDPVNLMNIGQRVASAERAYLKLQGELNEHFDSSVR